MKSIFFILLLISAKLTTAQDCTTVTEESLTEIGSYLVDTLFESDGLRDGPDYDGATIYYPENPNSICANIVIVPGFFATESDIEEWGPFLASHGIITMTIGTNNLWDQPDDRANALIDAIETLKQENNRVGSPLIGIVDTTKFAVAGWSMGGGGAQLAAVQDPSIRAVMAFCPWLDPSTTPNLNHTSPVLIFSGENDPTAPPEDHADIHYAETPDQTDKTLFEIAGGVHNVANTPTGANGEIGKLGLAWLQRYLIGNYCYCPVILDDLLNQPVVTSSYLHNINCDLLSESSIEDSRSVEIYPNFVQNELFIEFNTMLISKKEYQIINLQGNIVLKGELNSELEIINVSELAQGMYYISVIQEYELIETVKFIKN